MDPEYLPTNPYNKLFVPIGPFKGLEEFADQPLLFQPPPLSQFGNLSNQPLLFTTPFY